MSDLQNVPEVIPALYETYIDAVAQVEAKRKPTDGILGFGNDPARNPCHADFADSLALTVSGLAAEPVSPAEAEAVLNYIFRQHKELRLPRYAFVMLEAVHGHVLPLVPLLSKERAGQILAGYEAAYPRATRLPSQEKLVAALRERAGLPAKRGLFSKLSGRGRQS